MGENNTQTAFKGCGVKTFIQQVNKSTWSVDTLQLVLGIGLKNQNRLIVNSKRSIIDYNRFSACFVRKTEYSFFLPNIIIVVF